MSIINDAISYVSRILDTSTPQANPVRGHIARQDKIILLVQEIPFQRDFNPELAVLQIISILKTTEIFLVVDGPKVQVLVNKL